MVEHQPRLLGSRVRFPAGAFAIFFRFCQSFTSSFPSPLSFPLSFSSSSFPFLFLSLRPFVCALNLTLRINPFKNHFHLARATDTVQVLRCTCSRAVAALQQPLARRRPQAQVHVHVRVGRRGRRVFVLFPSDSTVISHRLQFARSFQKLFPPPHIFVGNTTSVFFFSVRLKLKEVGPMSQTCQSSSLGLERRLVTAVVGLWTMVDTAVDCFWIRFDVNVVPALAFVLEE